MLGKTQLFQRMSWDLIKFKMLKKITCTVCSNTMRSVSPQEMQTVSSAWTQMKAAISNYTQMLLCAFYCNNTKMAVQQHAGMLLLIHIKQYRNLWLVIETAADPCTMTLKMEKTLNQSVWIFSSSPSLSFASSLSNILVLHYKESWSYFTVTTITIRLNSSKRSFYSVQIMFITSPCEFPCRLL